MNAQRTSYRHGLEVSFGPATKYRFLSSSPRYPWTEVTVIDEKAPGITFDGTPLVSNYEGAHCIYRGYMEQFECRGGKRLVSFRQVALKWVVGAERMAGVKREASLYDNELRPLHGKVVPHFYGFFKGIIGDVEVGCIVLDWCSGPPIKDTFELNRQRMLAGIALHKAGVRHGQIIEPNHYIPVQDGTLRVVGFSSARSHNCVGTAMLSRDVNGDEKPKENCSELAALESRFGVDADRLGHQVRLVNKIFPAFDPGFFYRY